VHALTADFRLALTGTPVENGLSELWSLYRAVFPGLLGSWDSFRARFAGPIQRGEVLPRQVLARLLRPFLLRRTKAEVLEELPAKTELVELVTLSPQERELYEDARLAAVSKLAKGPGSKQRFAILAAITRLRQLACHPRLGEANSPVPSSKLARLMELLATLKSEGHRALVFSQFTGHLALVREALVGAGFSHLYLDGQTPERERQRRVEQFQAGEGDLFLISLKAGGTGLNLTGADYVIHLDPWWNPAVEDQASDRAHRMGQQRPVTVLRLVSQGTLEETILALHAEKRGLVDSVLAGTDAAGTLSPEELMEFLGAGAPEPLAQ